LETELEKDSVSGIDEIKEDVKVRTKWNALVHAIV